MRLPRGWWRPLVVYGGVAPVALGASGARDPTVLATAVLASAPVIAGFAMRRRG